MSRISLVCKHGDSKITDDMSCCRLGSESDKNPSEDHSYVVTGTGSGFHVTQENITPHASPNPRANGKGGFSSLNGPTRYYRLL